ncbi:MAG: VCBS repeat-containing protein, partial [bacterium]|nr:VCBS repeat-containing protein [bacterium]
MKQFIIIIALLLATTQPTGAQPAFTDVTSQAGVPNSLSGSQQRLATGLAWGDYDGDGDLDLYITNWGSSVSPTVSTNRLYRNNGNGTFSDVAAQAGVADNRNSIAALWADYDNDGDLDLYVVNFSEQDQLYRNEGGGSFSRVTSAAGVNVISQGSETGAAWGDYDGDGDLDLYLCKYYFRNSFYINNGNGSFSENAASAGIADIRDSEHAAWGDYDGDGDLDLYVVNREQNNALYRNNGNGSFSEVACALSLDNTDVGQAASWIDYDNDGDLDLFLANIGANALYRNDGNNTFVNIAENDMQTTPSAWVSWTGVWGDFDNDGDP